MRKTLNNSVLVFSVVPTYSNFRIVRFEDQGDAVEFCLERQEYLSSEIITEYVSNEVLELNQNTILTKGYKIC